MCDRRGMDYKVTHWWWECLCQHHPDLTLRVAANLSSARMQGSSSEAIEAYFEELKETIFRNKLADKLVHT